MSDLLTAPVFNTLLQEEVAKKIFVLVMKITQIFLITYESQPFYKKACSTVIRHLGRDSHYAILHNALWVNANLFQTDLCRDPEPKGGVII